MGYHKGWPNPGGCENDYDIDDLRREPRHTSLQAVIHPYGRGRLLGYDTEAAQRAHHSDVWLTGCQSLGERTSKSRCTRSVARLLARSTLVAYELHGCRQGGRRSQAERRYCESRRLRQSDSADGLARDRDARNKRPISVSDSNARNRGTKSAGTISRLDQLSC